MTVRRALSELVNEGLLIRERGRGSFVIRPRVQDELRQLMSFTEEMTLRGFTTRAEIVDFRVVTDETATNKMKIPVDEELVQLQRIRFAKNEPIALETALVRHQFCPSLTENGLEQGSLYRTLEERYGLHLDQALQTIRAKPADKYEAKMLRVNIGQAMIWLERLTFLRDGQPVEYVRSTYRGDRYSFIVKLIRSPDICTLEETLRRHF